VDHDVSPTGTPSKFFFPPIVFPLHSINTWGTASMPQRAFPRGGGLQELFKQFWVSARIPGHEKRGAWRFLADILYQLQFGKLRKSFSKGEPQY
jgi:hypothetical protein